MVFLAAGRRHSVARRHDGTVLACGHDGAGECYTAAWTGVTAIAAGSAHTLGLLADGTVVAAGCADDGRCAVEAWNLHR
ncbi:MAG: hypothetical protein QM809_08975 [Gordonia sp. (in: high G+C Gram-positive bacteria)]|uniref:hypothetical protein n=1 Tax=Gordonia sp. (in: high G+C Gram-positive bacteria) TaxID=84139 RepID=UPI0039E462E9